MTARAARRGGTSTPAIGVVAAAGVAHRVHAYDHDAQAHREGLGYGAEAAKRLDLPAGRVCKTLVTSADAQLVVAVVPSDTTLDLKALAAVVGARRAVMADPVQAERATGYVVGGISPLGHRRKLPVVVDASVLEHATVFVSAGRRGLELELDPHDLVRLAAGTTAAIAR